VTRADEAALLAACRATEPAATVAALAAADGWNSFRVALPSGSPARETLAGALIGAGITLREIAEDRYGLEDIFLAATRRAPGDARRP
jgi:phosphate/sulfate permease